MNWEDIQTFLAVAETGTIRGAGTRLRLNHATVSRRIAAFEGRLGVRLFDRVPGGYALTSAGEEMVAVARKVGEDIEALERRLLGLDAQLKGDLRVTMSDVLAQHLLMPDLTAFSRTYPGIELGLFVSDELFSLSRRDADVAIRIQADPPEYLIGQRLVTFARAAYASVDYLEHNPDPLTSRTAFWIGWGDPVRAPRWVADSDMPTLPIRHRFDAVLPQLEAAKAGLGIAMLPCFVGDTEPSLRRVPPGTTQPARPIWLLTHEDLRTTARVRAFMEFFRETFRRHRDLLEGNRPYRGS